MSSYFEKELFVFLTGLLSSVPSLLFGIATYVLSALAIYTISRRRGLKKPWLAWIPVVNVWLLGSLSDQYRYVVRGENKSKRKVLLALSILMAVLWVLMMVLAIMVAGLLIVDDLDGVIGPTFTLLGLLLPWAGVTVAYVVIRYMALYDVFKSLDPANSVLFLVLSIFFRVTEPFFLFFSRNKDQGMPPRRQETVYTQQETWEKENKDYL